jgi:hypothetical protein
MHVDIDAHQPVTLAVVSLQSWNDEGQRPESMAGLNLLCVQEHVLQTTYACDIPDRTVPSSGSASDLPAEPATAHWNGDGKLTFRWRLCRFHEPPCRPHGLAVATIEDSPVKMSNPRDEENIAHAYPLRS